MGMNANVGRPAAQLAGKFGTYQELRETEGMSLVLISRRHPFRCVGIASWNGKCVLGFPLLRFHVFAVALTETCTDFACLQMGCGRKDDAI